MGTIAEKLRSEAWELKTAKDELEWQQTKLAAIQVLEGSGMRVPDAAAILTGLEEQVKSASEQVVLKDLSHYSDTMIKSAAYIEELEAKIASMSGELAKTVVEKQAGVVNHLAKKGFEPDEVAELLNLPEATLQKVAGVPEPAWEMGKVASANPFNAPEVDAVTAWLMNSQ